VTAHATWDEHVASWSQPPVDDVGYFPSTTLLAKSDDDLRRVVTDMATARYTGWRNYGGLWRDVLALDRSEDLDILDYGCGVGMEALELARRNRVTLADLSTSNLALANRVVTLGVGYPARTVLVEPAWPFVPEELDGTFDAVHCSGVLHHIRDARSVVLRFAGLLRSAGELRLMVYSDIGWRQATGVDAPYGDVTAHPGFPAFVSHFDQVGDYATWYDRQKLTELAGDWFTVERFVYLCEDHRYAGALLRLKE